MRSSSPRMPVELVSGNRIIWEQIPALLLASVRGRVPQRCPPQRFVLQDAHTAATAFSVPRAIRLRTARTGKVGPTALSQADFSLPYKKSQKF